MCLHTRCRLFPMDVRRGRCCGGCACVGGAKASAAFTTSPTLSALSLSRPSCGPSPPSLPSLPFPPFPPPPCSPRLYRPLGKSGSYRQGRRMGWTIWDNPETQTRSKWKRSGASGRTGPDLSESAPPAIMVHKGTLRDECVRLDSLAALAVGHGPAWAQAERHSRWQP